jgi:hypothetical protein
VPDECYIYVLVEHKSYADRWVSLQLLRYMAEIWRNHRDEHPDDQALPPIIPVVFATAPRAASAAVDFCELVRVEFDTERFVPRFEVVVYDALTEQARRATLRFAVAIRVFQAAARDRRPDIACAARLLRRARGELANWRDVTDASLNYLAARLDAERREILARELDESGFDEGARQVMTIIEKSRMDGALEAKRATLIRLVSKKFGISETEAELIRAVSDVEKIDAALDTFAVENDKEAVFRQLR